MRQLVKVLLITYVLAVLLLTAAFLVQRNIALREHIQPAPPANAPQFRVVIRGEDGRQERATVEFVDDSLVAAHRRMGNEIEEHLLSLFWLNVSTAVLLAVLGLATLRLTPPSKPWLVPLLQRLRGRSGHCVRCGYDLRGSPVGGACPECGTVPGSSRAAPAHATA